MKLTVTKVYKDSYDGTLKVEASVREGDIYAELGLTMKITPGVMAKVTVDDTFEIPLKEVFEKAYTLPALEYKEPNDNA